MARPQVVSRTRRESTPNTIRDTTPLNVNAASGTAVGSDAGDAAQALANFAGAGAVYNTQRLIKNDQKEIDQARVDAANQVRDEELFQEQGAYWQTREKIRGVADWSRHLPEINAELEKWGVDEHTEEEVSAKYNELVRETFDMGLNPSDEDKVYLATLAPFILGREIDLITAHKDASLARERDIAQADFIEAAVTDYGVNKTLSAQEIYDAANTIRDGDDVNALVFAAFNEVSLTGHPEIWDELPSHITGRDGNQQATILNTPRFLDHIESSRARGEAEAKRIRAAEIAVIEESQKLARIHTLDEFWQQAQAGNLDIISLDRETIQDANGLSMITEAQNTSLRRIHAEARTSDSMSPYMIQAIHDGTLPFDDGDSKYHQVAFTAALSQVPEEKREAYAIDRGAVNGLMLELHEQAMSMTNSSNANYGESLRLFNEYETRQPGFAARHLPDDAVRGFHAMQHLQAAGATEQQAQERMRNFDSKLAEAVPNAERRAALESVVSNATDLPWTWREAQARPTLYRDLEQLVDTGLGLNMTVTEASEFAIDHIKTSRVEVDGNVFNANHGWGQDPQAAADYGKTSRLPEGEDADDYIWRPTPREPGMVTLQRRNALLPFGANAQTVRISDLGNEFVGRTREIRLEAQVASDEERRRDYTNRAMNNLWPLRAAGPDARAAGTQQQLEWWNGLTDNERNAAVNSLVADDAMKETQRQQRAAERAERLSEVNMTQVSAL